MTGQPVRKLSESCPDMSGDNPETDRTDNNPLKGLYVRRPVSGPDAFKAELKRRVSHAIDTFMANARSRERRNRWKVLR
jgi:hypothetical protein